MNWMGNGVKFVQLVFTVVLSTGFASAEDDRIHVVLLNPDKPNTWFWEMTTDFMHSAAKDLDIELEILYSNRNHMLTVRQAVEVTSREAPPDYILTGNEKGSAGGVIQAAQDAGVKVFLFNNAFVNDQDIMHFGKPRATYPMWIGQYLPDNFSAGYKMGKILIERGKAKGLAAPDGTLQILAIAGAFNTHASSARVEGLKAAVNEHSDQATLIQVVSGDWSEQTAYQKSLGLIARYEHLGAIWGANDSTAFGAMRVAQEIGKIPGKDILFAGCGWSSLGINKVKDGTLATTVGGHFMDGAWSLVMLYDYHHGKDFNNDSYTPEMYSIDRHNIDQYMNNLGPMEWDAIDFTQFSKTLNPSLESYDFSLDAVLKQFE